MTFMRLSAWLLVAGCFSVWMHPHSASAGFMVTMTGTIGSGTLNGESIAGESFVFTANIATGEDVFDDWQTGVFALENAKIRFGAGKQFIFTPGELYFGYIFSAGDLYPGPGNGRYQDLAVGFTTWRQTEYDDGLVYNVYSEEPPFFLPMSFDPNLIQPFYLDDFDGYDLGVNTSSFANGNSSLFLASIQLPGSVEISEVVSPVPEPDTLSLITVGGIAIVLRPLRRRRC